MANTRFAYTNRLEATATWLLNGPAVATGVVNQWNNGSAVVTISTGSYLTLGVKPMAMLSGNLAAKFPANTRINTVDSATQLTLTAAATAGGSGTDSATFTPDRALEQDSAYPMTNATNGQRYIPWRTSSSPAGTIIVEYDLGSALACLIGAALYIPSVMVSGISTQRVTTVEVQSSTDYVTWTSRGTGTPTNLVADIGVVFGSVSARFWRFVIVNTGQFACGKLWVGAIQHDMGVRYSPGTIKGMRKNRTQAQSAANLRQSFYHSRNLHQWSLAYGKMTDADRALIDTLYQQQKSFVFIDENDVFVEAEPDDAWGAEVVFLNLHNTQLVIEELV